MGWVKGRGDFRDDFQGGYWPYILEPKVLLCLANVENLKATFYLLTCPNSI